MPVCEYVGVALALALARRQVICTASRKSSRLKPIEAAVLRTVLYGDVFNFPMTAREIHHFLVHDEPVSLRAVENALASPGLLSYLHHAEGYVVRVGRADLIPVRVAREQASRALMPQALRYGVWLSRLPFVRMVALTGALAMRNAAGAQDDLDYLLVTTPGRVWLARAFSIALVRLVKRRGVVICPNYVLAESALMQERQDLFIAHEVAQMVPLFGKALYDHMRGINAWVVDYLPNADGVFYSADADSPQGFWMLLKRGIEALLGGRLGDVLEGWEHRRKLRRFSRDMQTPHHAARLDDQQVKGHFHDHGYVVLEQYAERLRDVGLEVGVLSLSAD